MRILLSPQVRENNKIWYEIEDEKITATINDKTDTFDFSGLPDGELELYDRDGNSLIETVLEESPIMGARRIDGVLEVEILFSINSDEDDMRLLFPEPMDLNEFHRLMEELRTKNEARKEAEAEIEASNTGSGKPVINTDFETVREEADYLSEEEYIDIEGVDF